MYVLMYLLCCGERCGVHTVRSHMFCLRATETLKARGFDWKSSTVKTDHLKRAPEVHKKNMKPICSCCRVCEERANLGDEAKPGERVAKGPLWMGFHRS